MCIPPEVSVLMFMRCSFMCIRSEVCPCCYDTVFMSIPPKVCPCSCCYDSVLMSIPPEVVFMTVRLCVFLSRSVLVFMTLCVCIPPDVCPCLYDTVFMCIPDKVLVFMICF